MSRPALLIGVGRLACAVSRGQSMMPGGKEEARELRREEMDSKSTSSSETPISCMRSAKTDKDSAGGR